MPCYPCPVVDEDQTRGFYIMQETIFTTANSNTHSARENIKNQTLFRQIMPLATGFVLVGIWQVIYLLKIYPSFIVPAPIDVIEKLHEVIISGSLWLHTLTTLQQVLPGLALGLASGITLGYLIAQSRLLEDALSPIIVAFQSTPIVAYAPLLVIWFGNGPTSKVITSALIVFFPILMNTIVGIRNVSPDLRDLMRVLHASRWQIFTKLEIPAAMPVLIGGLKVSATLAVIGAVVGEFVSANAGLGFLINIARQQYDTPLVIVAVMTLTLMALALYNLVTLLERYILAWQYRAHRKSK